jgi:hypothetical protein
MFDTEYIHGVAVNFSKTEATLDIKGSIQSESIVQSLKMFLNVALNLRKYSSWGRNTRKVITVFTDPWRHGTHWAAEFQFWYTVQLICTLRCTTHCSMQDGTLILSCNHTQCVLCNNLYVMYRHTDTRSRNRIAFDLFYIDTALAQ